MTTNDRLLATDNPYSIFRLPEALTCWQAVSVMGASYFGAALLAALGGMLGQVSVIFSVLLGLAAFVVVLAGTSGAGVCLTDLARARPYRGVPSYFVAGLFSLPKLLGAGLLMLLLYGAVLLGAALVLLVCKLPGIGPLLLVVAIPVLVLAVALALLGNYVAGSIVGPAIWDGERVMHALSITWSITRNHPFAAIGKIIGGLLLSGIFAAMLFGLVAIASAIVAAIGGPIIGMGMGVRFDMGALMGGYGGGHFLGAGIGYALVFVTAMAFVFLLPLMVGVLTWCEFSEKVDLGRIRSTTDKTLSEVNAKVAEMKEKAQSPAQAHSTQPMATAPSAAPAVIAATAAEMPSAAAAHATAHCPRCSQAVQKDDRFCEHCGQQL
ncbi:zinc ribbon domain-containing protein [Acidovorax radicis]|uniref:zinc ribbon domain-containing protein n=1 Tax=Acidovorax radicis TaxID=758826 RepID=UPI001CF91A9C|nr:zinc ribbon domain-containing protein [Acidovorax radicis]UCU99432.1 zinc ribbon domain-containing protein [Acidovorax radicis]